MGTRGEETVEAVAAGGYRTEDGTWVSIAAAVAAAVAGTKLVRPGTVADLREYAHPSAGDCVATARPPGTAVGGEETARKIATARPPGTAVGGEETARKIATARPPGTARIATRVNVTGETTTAAGARLARTGTPTTLLCFASAKNPGGGFLGNAKAQEEDLARASALYACQRAHPAFYAANRREKSLLYTDHLLWSPGVPFFRDDAHRWLPEGEVFHANVVTSPAPNAGEYRRAASDPAAAGSEETARSAEVATAAIRETLRRRAGQVLAVAAAEAPGSHLVLGAWGCGVFRNDPREVAAAFAEHLLPRSSSPHRSIASSFASITFAVWGRKEPNENRAVFEAVFGEASST
jgi:uncharacterized protein (TIGR02452 family)